MKPTKAANPVFVVMFFFRIQKDPLAVLSVGEHRTSSVVTGDGRSRDGTRPDPRLNQRTAENPT